MSQFNRLEVSGEAAEITKFIESNFQPAEDPEVLTSDEMVTFTFETSTYYAIDKIVAQVARQFRELKFELYYYETDFFEAGLIEFVSGTLRRDEHHEDEKDVHEFIADNFAIDLQSECLLN